MALINIFQSSDFYVTPEVKSKNGFVICLHKRIAKNVGKNPILIRGFFIEMNERYIVILNSTGYHLADRKNYIISRYDNVRMYAAHSRVALYYIASRLVVPNKVKFDLFNNKS